MGRNDCFSRGFLIENKGTVCCNCGENNEENITFHHVIPLSLGGKDILTNIVPLCHNCHMLLHHNTRPDGSLSYSSLIKEGMRKAKENGKKFGRPRVKKEIIDTAISLYLNGTSVRNIEKTIGISRGTLYKALKERNINLLTETI